MRLPPFLLYIAFIISNSIFLSEAVSQRISDKEILFNRDFIYQIDFSFDDSIYVLNYRDEIKIYRSGTSELLRNISVNSHAIDVANKSYLLSYGDESGNIFVTHLQDRDKTLSIPAHRKKVTCIRFSNNDALIATTGGDNSIKIWSSESGGLIAEIKGHKDLVTDFRFSPDDSRLVSCGADKTVKVWDLNDFSLLKSFKNNSRWVRKIAVSPDGSRFATAADDYKIHIYSFDDLSFYQIKQVHVNLISDIKFLNENYIISIGHDQKVSLSSIHVPADKQLLDFFNGNPSYRHYFRGVLRNKYFTSLAVNNTTGRIYISTLGKGILTTPCFHRMLNTPHDIFISKVDDFVVDSTGQRNTIAARRNPFKLEGSVSRAPFIQNARLHYVNDDRSSSLIVTPQNGKFIIQGLITNTNNEYKIIVSDKDPHMGISEYYFKVYRHTRASFPEEILPGREKDEY